MDYTDYFTKKKCSREVTHGGSNISAHVLLNLLNEFRKSDKMRV